MIIKLLKFTTTCIILCMSFCFSGCKDGGYGYDDPFISTIEGKWYINDESEYVDFMKDGYIFEMNDWEVFGNFIINEDKPNEVLVIYEDLDGIEHCHVMHFHAYLGSNKSMWVDDAPMHEGERVLMYRP